MSGDREMARPRLARHARLRFDRHAGKMLLLGPERGLLLGPTAAAIVELCDGERSVRDIVDALVERYGAGSADRIATDTERFLADLAALRLLDRAEA